MERADEGEKEDEQEIPLDLEAEPSNLLPLERRVVIDVGGQLFHSTFQTLQNAGEGSVLHDALFDIEAYRQGSRRLQGIAPKQLIRRREEFVRGLAARGIVPNIPFIENGPYPDEDSERGVDRGEPAPLFFIDRNPSAFSTVLDFLRTGKFLLPSHVTRVQAEAEMDFLGLQTQASTLRDTARHALEVLYSQHLQVRIGLIQRPYGVGIEPEDSLKASEQLAKLFDYGAIDDDLVQSRRLHHSSSSQRVMAVRECRYELQRRLQIQGLLCINSYSHGDIYGHLIPVHVWFVVGLETNVVDDYTEDVREMLRGWRPHSLSNAPNP